jgi:hypothetical protein
MRLFVKQLYWSFSGPYFRPNKIEKARKVCLHHYLRKVVWTKETVRDEDDRLSRTPDLSSSRRLFLSMAFFNINKTKSEGRGLCIL